MNFKVFSLMILTCALISVSSSHAGKGNGSHGGSIVFVKGKWKLADLYVKQGLGEEIRLSNEMQTYLDAALNLAERYGADLSPLREKLLGRYAEYRLVTSKQLPCQDEPLQLGEHDGVQLTFGCTDQDEVTYLAQDRLKLLKESNPEDAFKYEALALIHEKLHTLDEGKNAKSGSKKSIRSKKAESHLRIANFVHALYLMISLQEEQNQGVFRDLYVSELRTLEGFREIAKAVGATQKISPYRLSVHIRGGGVYLKQYAQIAFDATIGIGSVIGGSENFCHAHNAGLVMISSDSTVIDSVVRCSSQVQGSWIENSHIEAVGLQSAVISRSNLVGNYSIHQSIVQESKIFDRNLEIKNSHLVKVKGVTPEMYSERLGMNPNYRVHALRVFGVKISEEPSGVWLQDRMLIARKGPDFFLLNRCSFVNLLSENALNEWVLDRMPKSYGVSFVSKSYLITEKAKLLLTLRLVDVPSDLAAKYKFAIEDQKASERLQPYCTAMENPESYNAISEWEKVK